jgi:hypothetical protein
MHGGTPIERAREEISKCRLLKEQARRTRERTFELLQALQESLAHTRRYPTADLPTVATGITIR